MSPVVDMNSLDSHIEDRLSRAFSLIRSRVGVGFIRYESNRGRSPCYLDWLDKSLVCYKETKNLDALLDVAFFAIAEFENPSVEGTFYEHSKDEGIRSET
jgi:hypothetical protein